MKTPSGIKYRYKNEKGDWVGGAMIYIEKGWAGNGSRWFFSVFVCWLPSASAICHKEMKSPTGFTIPFPFPKWATALIVMLLAGLVIVGGIKRIASVTEKLVPFMAVTYIVGSLVVIFTNASAVPDAFGAIFGNRFQLSPPWEAVWRDFYYGSYEKGNFQRCIFQ